MAGNGENGPSDNEEEQYSSEDRVPRKRRHEKDEDYPAKRPSVAPPKQKDIMFRIVVPSNKIGRVIGKQGSRINQLREETGAKIKIADPVMPLEERVIIISSKGEEEDEKSAAEHALIQIVTVILEESEEPTTTKVGLQHASPNMTRLLIAGSQAGSLIGVSGSNIKEIRNDSGATVQILPQDHLPICASASETDRLVQISGKVSQVLKALELIGGILREHPPKEVISMRPSYNMVSATANQLMLLSKSALPGYTMQLGNTNPAFAYLGAAGRPVRSIFGTMGGIAADSATPTLPKVTSEMTISSSVVGGLIGKGGSNISQIRSLSGATIKVTGEKDATMQRTIYFEGSAEQVAIAQRLVNTYLNAQMQQQQW